MQGEQIRDQEEALMMQIGLLAGKSQEKEKERRCDADWVDCCDDNGGVGRGSKKVRNFFAGSNKPSIRSPM